jgi:hypothetical protein
MNGLNKNIALFVNETKSWNTNGMFTWVSIRLQNSNCCPELKLARRGQEFCHDRCETLVTVAHSPGRCPCMYVTSSSNKSFCLSSVCGTNTDRQRHLQFSVSVFEIAVNQKRYTCEMLHSAHCLMTGSIQYNCNTNIVIHSNGKQTRAVCNCSWGKWVNTAHLKNGSHNCCLWILFAELRMSRKQKTWLMFPNPV